MRRLFAIAAIVLLLITCGRQFNQAVSGQSAIPSPTAAPDRPTKPVPALVRVQLRGVLEPDNQAVSGSRLGDRQALLSAIANSLRYLATTQAGTDYQRFAAIGINRDLVRRSLERFRQLLLKARSESELQTVIEREFVLYQATGKDGQGTVGFTGYFEPTYTASLTQTKEFRYPIFRVPSDFAGWSKPHPTRSQLEGVDGLQFNQGRLKGQALVWFRDRLEAYLTQVQGSARLQLTTGKPMTVGYAAATDYPYTSVGRELVNDGKIRQEDLTLPALIQYFQQNPAGLNEYLPRNRRFVFFRETGGAPASGSLGVPVTPEQSIATDKSLFPPGALAFIQAQLPYIASNGQFEQRRVGRFVLDQDTGSAIKGAGRVDIFMGTGKQAGDRAGLINSTGQLYYLLLRK